MKIDKKPLLILVLIVFGVFVLFALITKGGLSIKGRTPSPQTSIHCSEEFLEEFKKATPSSSEQVNRYLDCQPVAIFLKDSVSENQVSIFVDELKNQGGVYKVDYISKDDALKIYKERYKNEPLLLENISRDIFPASISVYVSEPSLKDKLTQFAKGNSLVQSVVGDK